MAGPRDLSGPARPGEASGVVGVILAAGAGSRFGSPKQLAALDGRPLLEYSLIAMSNATTPEAAIVVLGANAERILAEVALHGVEPVICDGWQEGQAASLRAGIAALRPRCTAIVVVLGDQPAIDSRAIDRVVGARAPGIAAVRATYRERPGHPVLLEHSLFASLAAVRGDQGARGVLAGSATRQVQCDGLGSDLDIDTPAQLAAAASQPG